MGVLICQGFGNLKDIVSFWIPENRRIKIGEGIKRPPKIFSEKSGEKWTFRAPFFDNAPVWRLPEFWPKISWPQGRQKLFFGDKETRFHAWLKLQMSLQRIRLVWWKKAFLSVDIFQGMDFSRFLRIHLGVSSRLPVPRDPVLGVGADVCFGSELPKIPNFCSKLLLFALVLSRRPREDPEEKADSSKNA